MNLIPLKHLKRHLSQLKPAVNGGQSQSFGRRLHHLQVDDQLFWLKFQYQGFSPSHELSFQNELNIYKQLQQLNLNITAPFQIIASDAEALSTLEPYLEGILTSAGIESILCVQHLPALFLQDPQQMPIKQVREMLLMSLEVVAQLHRQGFVHGDLKPMHFRQNQADAVLIDFEQAFHIHAKSEHDNTATPHYMAPELFHGEMKTYASDIYALGIIWLEWLNQHKLQQKSYVDWAKLHCQQLKIEMTEQFKCFEPVLTLMLAKQKQHRCTNFYQIKQILNNNVY